jgi:hypothetical protein
MIEITNEYMSLTLDGEIIATARFSEHAAADGKIGALVSAWPALALVGSFELLMLLIRTHQRPNADGSADATPESLAPLTNSAEPSVVPPMSSMGQAVRNWHAEGRSQRAIARDLNIDRRKVKQIIDRHSRSQELRSNP